MQIELSQADITTLACEAIVNAANSTLSGGGGVDGAIHRAAGPALLEHCRTLGGCKTGQAKITPGFNLPACWVIHTVGPVWLGGERGEANDLALCYKNSLQLAARSELKSIAFPTIATGAYGYPGKQAAEIAFKSVAKWPEYSPERVIFVCFDEQTLDWYQQQLM